MLEENRQRSIELLEKIAEGKSMHTACKELGIPWQTVMSWRRSDEEFKAAYLEAKQDSADNLAEKISDLAQEAMDSPEKAQAIRVAMDAYKWIAAKLKPKSYGERIEQHVIEETATPSEVEARVRSLEEQLGLKQEDVEQEAGEAASAHAHTTTRTLPDPASPLH